jgi:hypothetical protein
MVWSLCGNGSQWFFLSKQTFKMKLVSHCFQSLSLLSHQDVKRQVTRPKLHLYSKYALGAGHSESILHKVNTWGLQLSLVLHIILLVLPGWSMLNDQVPQMTYSKSHIHLEATRKQPDLRSAHSFFLSLDFVHPLIVNEVLHFGRWL